MLDCCGKTWKVTIDLNTRDGHRMVTGWSSVGSVQSVNMHQLLEALGSLMDRGLNHVGDWGTQFGMLIEYMKEAYPNFQDFHRA